MGKGVKILETFRDSIQGLDYFIDTDVKIRILNSLLQVGYDFLDVGSFVSSRIIPQFSDMDAVLRKLDLAGTHTRLFALVANIKGALLANKYNSITILGYPFSTSESFLQRNINANFESSWRSVNEIQEECVKNNKDLMVYQAMAFGNPYGDPVDVDICLHWAEKFQSIGIKYIHLSDITGVSTPEQIGEYYSSLSRHFNEIEFGIHLHISEQLVLEKLDAAYRNGCLIFDGVISGWGGCPMTGYEMLRNLPGTKLLDYLNSQNIAHSIREKQFNEAKLITNALLKTSE